MSRVFRLLAVLIGLGGAAVVVVAGTRTWAHVTVPDVTGMQDLALSGRKAAALALPVALAAAAGVIVMATTGRLIRFLVALIVTAGGVAIVLSSLDARAHAARTATKALESTLSVFNQGAMIKLPATLLARSTTELTGWPLVSLAGGVLIAVAGLIGLITGWTWPAPASRFEADASAAPPSEAALASSRAGQQAGYETSGRPAPSATPADDARTWDALSRGDDPT